MKKENGEARGNGLPEGEFQDVDSSTAVAAMRIIADSLDLSELSAEQVEALKASLNLLQEKVRSSEASAAFPPSWREKFKAFQESLKAGDGYLIRTGEVPDEVIYSSQDLNMLCATFLEDIDLMHSLGNKHLLIRQALRAICSHCRYLIEDILAFNLEKSTRAYSSSEGESKILVHLRRINSNIDLCFEHMP